MECTPVRKIKTIYVLCGENPKKDRGYYVRAAGTLGLEMVKKKLDLAYEGDSLGLKGRVLTAICMSRARTCLRYSYFRLCFGFRDG